MAEQALDIKTADGVADSHVFYPDGRGAWPAIIFFMDGLGSARNYMPWHVDWPRRLLCCAAQSLLSRRTLAVAERNANFHVECGYRRRKNKVPIEGAFRFVVPLRQ